MESRTSLLKACAALMAMVASTASASLTPATYLGPAVGPESIAVWDRETGTVLWFDHDGRFLRDSRYVLDGEALVEGTLFLSLDGRTWLVDPVQGLANDDEPPVVTRVVAFAPSGEELGTSELPGPWTVRVTPRGGLYVARIQDQELRVSQLALGSNEPVGYANLPMERVSRMLDLSSARAYDWTIDASGNVVVLTTRDELGWVRRYAPTGEVLQEAAVEAYPVTSVAYCRSIDVDARDQLWVSHSSAEGSSAIGNQGGVMVFDRAGNMTARLAEPIGYLRGFGTTPAGEVFVGELGDDVLLFGADGCFRKRFLVKAPPDGMSWDERERRMAAALTATPASSDEVLMDVVRFGDDERRELAESWLKSRGEKALEAVSRTAASDRSLSYLAWSLWTEHPESATAYHSRILATGTPSEIMAVAEFLVEDESRAAPWLGRVRQVLEELRHVPAFEERVATCLYLLELSPGASSGATPCQDASMPAPTVTEARTPGEALEARPLPELVRDMKRLGFYGREPPDPLAFGQHGEEGERTLAALTSYPNEATQVAAWVALSALRSKSARPRLEALFDEHLRRAEVPPDWLVLTLVLFGEDPIPLLVDAQIRTPRASWWSFWCPRRPELDALADRLAEMLLSERDPVRAEALGRLLFYGVGKQPPTTDLATRHPDPAIRDVLARIAF